MNFLDLFALKLREKRIQQKITQRGLAEKLNMCTRTIIEIENCKSNPKFETVALISKEMRISLDAVVFHDENRVKFQKLWQISLPERVMQKRSGILHCAKAQRR